MPGVQAHQERGPQVPESDVGPTPRPHDQSHHQTANLQA